MKSKLSTIIAALGLLASPVHAFVVSTNSSMVYNSAGDFSGSFAKGNVLDGTSSEYASNNQGTNTFVDINFGSAQSFDRVVAITRNSGANTDLFKGFTLTFSSDNVFGGGDATHTQMGSGAQGSSGIYSLGSTVTSQYVRFDVDTFGNGTTGATGNTGITEMLFLQTPTGTQVVDSSTISITNSYAAFSAGFANTRASDGIVGFGNGDYASSGGGTNTFVNFDFGISRDIAGFDLIDRLAEKTSSFSLQFSNDPTFMTGVTTKDYTGKGSNLTQSDLFTGAINARYVRYDANGGTGNTGLNELIFYQVPEPSAALLGGLGMLCLLRRRRNA